MAISAIARPNRAAKRPSAYSKARISGFNEELLRPVPTFQPCNQALEIGPFKKVTGWHGLEAARIGFNQSVRKRIGNCAASVLLVILQFGLIQLIVLKALAEAVYVVHMSLERSASCVLCRVGVVGLDSGGISGGTAASFVTGELLSNDLAVNAVAVVDCLHGGLHLRSR